MANDREPESRRPRLPRQDTIDFVSAFAVGAALGVGATLLLAPERTRTERVVRRLKPPARQLRRSVGEVREAIQESGGAAADFSGEVISAGRELLSEFRAEVARIVEDARSDLRDAMEDASRQVRRGKRRFGT